MQNKYTRVAYEVTVFLAKRTKSSQVGVNLSSLLHAPIELVMAPSRRIANMFRLGGSSRSVDSEGVACGAGSESKAESPGKKPGSKRKKRTSLQTASQQMSQLLSKVTSGDSEVALPLEDVSNPFLGVNAQAGLPVPLQQQPECGQ